VYAGESQQRGFIKRFYGLSVGIMGLLEERKKDDEIFTTDSFTNSMLEDIKYVLPMG